MLDTLLGLACLAFIAWIVWTVLIQPIAGVLMLKKIIKATVLEVPENAEALEIKTEVMALGRKGAEAWCLQQVIAYDPELSQLELDTAYKNLKNMDLNELGDAIVEMDAL